MKYTSGQRKSQEAETDRKNYVTAMFERDQASDVPTLEVEMNPCKTSRLPQGSP